MDGVEILCLGKLGLSIGTSLYFDTHKFCQRLMVALKHTRFAAKILLIAAVIGQNVWCTAKKKLNRVPPEKVNFLRSGCNLYKQVLSKING